jgi:DNA polymerase III alpha subunit
VTFKNFATPHCHVQSLDSASTPEAFAARELELETGVITVTDHGTLAACQRVYDLGHKKKLTPILGLEGYFRDDNCPILLGAGMRQNNDGKMVEHFKYGHFTTHFLDQDAFKVGIRLLSRAPVERHGSESKPLFNWAMMEELAAANVTLTTGCLIGMVPRHILDRGDLETAKKYLDRLRAITRPGHLYVEAFPHVCSHNWVQGVFLTIQESEGSDPIKLRFYAGKTLRTNAGEIKAADLAKEFKHKDNAHQTLLAVKDYHTWVERTPAKLLSVEHIEDFIQNECRPYAPEGDVQLGANKVMVEFANANGLPILISDDSHYAHTDEKVVQDVRLAQSGSWRFYGSYHRQSSAEAWEYFHQRMGIDERTFGSWVDNSHAWADRFKGFKLEAKPNLPTKFYEMKYAEVGAKNSLEYTIHLVKQHGRMDWKDPVRVRRLQQEIKLLYQNGVIDLLPYFMLDEEVCRLYRDRGMLTGPGRGSAAGLSLAYYLGITHVDPLKFGLSLDRFLTPDRINSGKLPDIDQDLPTREPLVGPEGKHGWLHDRFGECVAQISTIMTLKLSSAVLDVARFTLGRVPPDIAALSKKFERPPQGLEDYKFVHGYEDSGNWVDGSITFDPALQEYVNKYPDQWKIVQKCLGLGRGISRHACAYVIANNPIWEFIPLTLINEVVCTQFTAPAVEAAGGLKMDFLVINSLNDIAQCINMVQERARVRHGMEVPAEGVTLKGKYVPKIRLVPKTPTQIAFSKEEYPESCWMDIWDLPEDQDVFADVATGRTETVFQYNTPGAVQWLRQFGYKKPSGHYAIDSIEDMAAFTALDRPGPLNAKVHHPDDETKTYNMLVEYARRARGAKPSPDIFPIFDQLFPETHGIMVYQEQLQKLYQQVTGCTGPEAEEFRGNVAKKKKEKIIAAYPGFIEGATATLGSKEDAEAVWTFIQTWAAYGFNKSHSVCYAVIGYACAFLKHHYPLEWWTAVLRNATKEEINEKFWRHCGKLINLPDVTKAHENFEIVEERIQAPLSLLHGVGEIAHKELLAGAPYTSIADVVEKIETKKLAGTTTKPGKKKVKKDGATVEVDVVKTVKGRSALNKGIIYKLIVSGAMDTLFPAGMSTLEMLEAYERAAFDYENKVRAGMVKPKRPKLRPDPVKAEYLNLTQYTRYQLRKQILPAYSEPVLNMLVERQHEKVIKHGRGYVYKWIRPVPFATAADIERINGAALLPESGVRVAVGAYVEEERVFEYGPKDPVTGRRTESKKAMALVINVDGVRMEFVRWPERDTNDLSDSFRALHEQGIKGSIVIAVLSKFKEGKPFTIDAVEVVQAPPGTTEESPDKEETAE